MLLVLPATCGEVTPLTTRVVAALEPTTIPDWVPVHDPRVFEEGRNVRFGMNITF